LIRIAILGGGAVTRLFYLPAFRLLDKSYGLAISCVVDASPVALASLEGKCPGARLMQQDYASYLGDVKERHDIDAVVVALPHHLHEPAVCRALESGFHVLCEKPLAIATESVKQMAHLARDRKRVLGVCHYRRHFPAVQAIRDIIASRQFGNCLSIDWREGQRYSWPVESLAQIRRQNGGEVLWDIGAHVLQVLNSWLGTCEIRYCTDDALSETSTATSFELELASGSTLLRVCLSRTIEWGTRVKLSFEHAEITWDTSEPNRFHVSDRRYPAASSIWEFSQLAKPHVTSCFVRELECFSRAIAGKQAEHVSGEQALAYVAQLEQCEALRRPAVSPQKKLSVLDWPEPLVKRVAVTGASGFIGGKLTERLMRSGLEVIPLARRPQSCVGLLHLGMEPALGDLADPAYLAAAFQGCSVVFHCAISWSSKDLRDTAVEGTEAVLQAAINAGVSRVVVMGSMMAYGRPPDSGAVDESFSGSGHDPYGLAKHEMTRRLASFAQRNTQPEIVVLEPTCVFGPGSEAFVRAPVEKMRRGEFYLIEQGTSPANLIHIDNLVDAMLIAATCKGLGGKRFILNEEEFRTTWAEYFGSFSDALALPPLESIPEGQLLQAAEAISRKVSGLQLFRQAVRSHPACSAYVSQHPLFRAYRKIRLAGTARPGEAARETQVQAANAGLGNEIVFARQFSHQSFIKLYSTKATYSSAGFRAATSWSPRVTREAALAETRDWVKAVYPRW
jgi:predicted dehydrogenase/nucleoside-diphosphate-sugar epimerase